MTKERLRRYRDICREIEQLSELQLDLRVRMENISSPALTGMPSGEHPETDRLAGLIDRANELRDRYRVKLLELSGEQLAIEEAIDSLAPRERTLCRLRYIDGLSWEKICCEIHLEWAQTHRLHRKALEHMAQK